MVCRRSKLCPLRLRNGPTDTPQSAAGCFLIIHWNFSDHSWDSPGGPPTHAPAKPHVRSRCKKPLPRFKFKICRASEKFRQADRTWTQPTPGGAPQPVFGSRGHKNGHPSTGTRCSAPMALGWCWWPQEAHGGHQTTPGGTGDVQGMFSCQGGAWGGPHGPGKAYFALFLDRLPGRSSRDPAQASTRWWLPA